MLNQEIQVEVSTKHPINTHNPLNDHDYCSPNKRIAQQQSNKPTTNPQIDETMPTTLSSDLPVSHSTPSTLPPLNYVPSDSVKPEAKPNNISRSCSNDNLSVSSSSSSSLSSVASLNKELVISQDSHGLKSKLTERDSTSSASKSKLARRAAREAAMEDETSQTKGRVRSSRVRQSTSVTDKSEWIMGDDQIDSVLSEHLDEDPKEKKHKVHKEHDSAFNQYTSSDYSSSNAESDQESEYNSEDDPDRLWCLCQKPHGGKFMICCDICKDWFHGHCVGVTKLMGDRFEKQGKEWFCGDCLEKLRTGTPRSAIPRKIDKKEKKKKKLPIPGRRGRGRPRKSETLKREGPTRVSQRTTRKSSSSLDPKVGVDNGRLKKNLARSEARSESFDDFEDSQRLKELIKERKKEFFYKRALAEQQKLAKRNELGLGRQLMSSNLSEGLDSLATSTSSPNMNSLPINVKSESKERAKPNIVLQINTKKDMSTDQTNASSRIVTAIVRSPKKTKHAETIDPTVSELFTAEPIQINKKVKIQSSTSSAAPITQSAGDTNTTNGDSGARRRSNSGSSSSKNDRSPSLPDGGEQSAKKRRKDSESSAPNGSSTSIGPQHIALKIKDSLESRSRQIKDLEVSSDKIEKLATEIEGQLSECFKEGSPKYLNKFRSLIFNLRDTKNQGLVKNVLAGDISPSKLVRMSPEEMASHELAKWRERENKHSIELIKRDAQLAAQQVIVKKTHKGEEVISAPLLNEPDDPSAVMDNQEPPTTPTKSSFREARAEVGSTITSTPPINSTTKASPLKMKITGITGSESSITKTIAIEPIKTPPPISSPLMTPTHSTPTQSTPTQSSPPQSTSSSTEPCWSGCITMPDVAKFSASAMPISGSLEFMKDEINQNLMICGRIAPDQVQGYIKKLKSTTKNQILIVQLFPLTTDDRTSFNTLFDYLYSRNRYGVIQTSPQILKDFYILPIHENSGIPDALKPMKGLRVDRKEPNCLLGLLVRTKRSAPPASGYTPTPIK